jgi:hypothetical protein
MQYGRGQPLPPWAAAIPGRHGGRDARGYTFTAAHEVNSRLATQLPATAPAKSRYATTKRLRVEVEGLRTQLARTRRRPNEDRIKVAAESAELAADQAVAGVSDERGDPQPGGLGDPGAVTDAAARFDRR